MASKKKTPKKKAKRRKIFAPAVTKPMAPTSDPGYTTRTMAIPQETKE